jgi:hypothetical protein
MQPKRAENPDDEDHDQEPWHDAATHQTARTASSEGPVIGGSGHERRNFYRDRVTEPSAILAALSEENMVNILHADPAVKRGCLNRRSSPQANLKATS